MYHRSISSASNALQQDSPQDIHSNNLFFHNTTPSATSTRAHSQDSIHSRFTQVVSRMQSRPPYSFGVIVVYWNMLLANKLGAFCLIMCIVIWILQSELVQFIQTEKEFNKPYFIIWWSNSLYTSMFPIQLIRRLFFGHSSTHNSSNHTRHHHHVNITTKSYFTKLKQGIKTSYLYLFQHPPPPASLIFVLAILSTLPNYLWYLALPRTTVSDITAVSNSSCIFAYISAVLLLGEKVSRRKVAGLALAFTGVLAISVAAALQVKDGATITSGSSATSASASSSSALSLHASSDTLSLALSTNASNTTTSNILASSLSSTPQQQTISLTSTPITTNLETRLIGDAMGIFGSAMFGLWDTVYTLGTRTFSSKSTSTSTIAQQVNSALSTSITALTGVACLLLLWIPLPILHFTNVELFSLPSSEVARYLFLVGILNCGYNSCYILGITLTSQVVFAVGLMMALPVTMVLDYVVRDETPHWISYIGVLFIVGAQVVLARPRVGKGYQFIGKKEHADAHESDPGPLDTEMTNSVDRHHSVL